MQVGFVPLKNILDYVYLLGGVVHQSLEDNCGETVSSFMGFQACALSTLGNFLKTLILGLEAGPP